MNRNSFCLLVALTLLSTLTHTNAQTTAFTYHGALSDENSPATGLFNLTFGLFRTDTGGTTVATVTNTSVSVSDGLFTTSVDFGAAVFDGTDYWLEIEVQPDGGGAFTTLSPRQPLTAVPYAIHARMAMDVVNPRFLGTTDLTPLDFSVNGQRGLRLVWNRNDLLDSVNVIGGSSANSVSSVAVGAVVTGGGHDFAANTVDGDFSSIGGGLGNSIKPFASAATIGGGGSNTVGANSHHATISGGNQNTIGTDAQNATIGGGLGNDLRASAQYCTISGGYQNVIEKDIFSSTIGGGFSNAIDNSANGATIPGGIKNIVSGHYSFAAGHGAFSLHDGSFVWADSPATNISDGFAQTIPFASETTNEFAVRAIGGVRFVTGIDANGTPTTGVSVPAGGTGWSVISDRSMKANFELVNGKEVLERVATLPIQRWNLKTQPDSIRHIGPMAQDFYAAFGVGEDERRINTVDADGVALAAIQGLNQKLEEKDAEIESLKQRMAELEKLVQRSLGQ